MTIALAVLTGAFTASWIAPNLLCRVDVRRRDPLLLIVLWLVSMAGVLLASTTGAVLLLVPGHGTGTDFLGVLHSCWSTLRHGSPPQVETFAGVLGILLLIVFAMRLSIVAVRGMRHRVRARREHLAVLRLVARADSGPSDILWLTHDRPLAFSMAGRPNVVVATDGLLQHLDPSAVEAVLAHERAHLRGRHHAVSVIAGALSTTLSFLPLFRRAPEEIAYLLEMAADVVAVRRCGTAAVRAALLTVSAQGVPTSGLAIARDGLHLRLARLNYDPAAPGPVGRMLSCSCAALTAVAAPFLVGTVLLAMAALVTCPLAAT